jgi:hypothetical protein
MANFVLRYNEKLSSSCSGGGNSFDIIHCVVGILGSDSPLLLFFFSLIVLCDGVWSAN